MLDSLDIGQSRFSLFILNNKIIYNCCITDNIDNNKHNRMVQMENIDKMRARHKKEIDELQMLCPHKEISDWMEYMWAPGHVGGQVRICKFCGKTIERKDLFYER